MWDQKTKALLLGTSAAAVVGLAASGALNPGPPADFDAGAGLISALTPSANATPSQPAGWTSYGQDMPDYVVGADWATAQAALLEAQADAPPSPQAKQPVRVVIEPPSTPTDTPSPPRLGYPSVGADIPAGMDGYAPPTPPRAPPPVPPAD